MDNESPNTSICGRQIVVTNTGSNDGVGGEGNVVTVTVADTCPSCDENHIDLSESAWKKLTNNAPDGTVLVDWLVYFDCFGCRTTGGLTARLMIGTSLSIHHTGQLGQVGLFQLVGVLGWTLYVTACFSKLC